MRAAASGNYGVGRVRTTRMTDLTLDSARLERLLDAGRVLVSELDVETVLNRLLAAASHLTGARYAAIGVLDERRRELERFLTRGVDETTHRDIGELPRGRGILGLLIEDPRPLRLHDIGEHSRSYGFPVGHPPMRNFLGVPILIRGEAWGNLYLTEKVGGDFDEADERSLVVLAGWAAVAIENARLYRTTEESRVELERAVGGLRATTEIARAVGAEVELARVLELIVKRGRALVQARSLIILLEEVDVMRVAAAAGEVPPPVHGRRVPIEDSATGEALRRHRSERIADVRTRLRASVEDLGVPDARAALIVPLAYRARPLGVLVAFDREVDGPGFSVEDEELLDAFAASAATAVATAQSVEADRLRHSLDAAESERRRWARELHDETLQGLGALRVLLAGGVRSKDPERLAKAARQAIEQVDREIAGLRSIIADLRPAALDELGLVPALDALLERVRSTQDLDVDVRVDLGDRDAGSLTPEVETTVYRLAQEALTNVVKHARAGRVTVELRAEDDRLDIKVVDDGVGFDPDVPTTGYGLGGMRERVRLCGGTLSFTSGTPGTEVRASLPLGHPAPHVAVRADVQASDPGRAAAPSRARSLHGRSPSFPAAPLRRGTDDR